MINAIYFYRVGRFCYKNKLVFLSKIVDGLIFFIYNSYIPSSCSIGSGSKFAYKGIGVVIHKRAVIGANCIIGQGITIGGKNGSVNPPVIGNNVYIAAGSRIIGDIHIGDNCIIGVNAVVTKSFEDNIVIGGIPAIAIKDNI
jgi:serine O-acetyltransferase